MNNFPPNTDPNLYSITAVIIGVLMCEENFSDYELNSIGNWLMLLGQYLETYAAQQQLIRSRQNNSGINFNNQYSTKEEFNYLYKAICRIEEELKKYTK